MDLQDFGIKAINVMPAGFRTEFAGSSLQKSSLKIQSYDTAREAFFAKLQDYNGKQAGNPQKFAEVLFSLSRAKNPPANLFLGENAFKSARAKIELIEADMKATQSYAGKAVEFSQSAKSAFSN